MKLESGAPDLYLSGFVGMTDAFPARNTLTRAAGIRKPLLMVRFDSP
jgi:hypothetical protein